MQKVQYFVLGSFVLSLVGKNITLVTLLPYYVDI